MAHELEIDQATGKVASVSGNNIDPWHRLGQVLPEGLSADQVLDEAFLRGWDVRKNPLTTTLTQISELGVTEELVVVREQFAVVRNNPFDQHVEVMGTVGGPGGVVGSIYTPFQNEQAVDFMAAVTDSYSDATYETAGSIRGGTQVFVSMALKDFLVGGVDGMKLYLVYLINHISGSNLTFATHIRPVCANTVDAGAMRAKFTFRHSASIDVRHQQARDALQLSFNYNAAFQKEAESMLAVEMGFEEFRKVCDEIWAQPEADAAEVTKRRWDERRGVLKDLFLFADTQDNIRRTRWGAFNAIAEYVDHVEGNLKDPAKNAEARALRTIDGGSKAPDSKRFVKEHAFALLKV